MSLSDSDAAKIGVTTDTDPVAVLVLRTVPDMLVVASLPFDGFAELVLPFDPVLEVLPEEPEEDVLMLGPVTEKVTVAAQVGFPAGDESSVVVIGIVPRTIVSGTSTWIFRVPFCCGQRVM